MSITSIELPAKDGMEWREVDGAGFSEHHGPRSLITDFDFPECKTRYFINVKIEPDWVSIPEGTLCQISYQTHDGTVEKVAERYGRSFAVVGRYGTVEPEGVLSVKPARLLGEDEVAVKKVPDIFDDELDWAFIITIVEQEKESTL